MKNSFIILVSIIFFGAKVNAENILIEAKDITLNKDQKTTIFKNNVSVETKEKKITSEFAEFNKNTQEVILKNNIIAKDKLNNTIKTNYAEFNNIKKIFKTIGSTTLITSQNYSLEGNDIYFDYKDKIMKSDKSAILKDQSGNTVFLDNFEYVATKSIFKSIGYVKIIDQFDNTYEFSQIYIDTKKKEVIGTDIKAFLNNQDFKINSKNDPRVFANTMRLNKESSSFKKSVFTLCELKDDEKCPPWTLLASDMTHDNKKKTIYYENAVIKIYDIPIFYLPFLSHPDPSVKRRTGLLPPTLSDSKNLGAGVSIPFFWSVNNDKNFTVTSKLLKLK